MLQSNALCIKKASFTRLVKDVVKDVVWFMNAQAEPGQHHELPTVSAEAITALFWWSCCAAQHANRTTITTRDVVGARIFAATCHIIFLKSCKVTTAIDSCSSSGWHLSSMAEGRVYFFRAERNRRPSCPHRH